MLLHFSPGLSSVLCWGLGSLWFGLVLVSGLDQPGLASTFILLSDFDGRIGWMATHPSYLTFAPGDVSAHTHTQSASRHWYIKTFFLYEVFSKGHLDHLVYIFPFYSRCFAGRLANWVLYLPFGFCVISWFKRKCKQRNLPHSSSQIFAALFKDIYLRRRNVQSSPFKTISQILCKIWREDWGVSDWIGITLNPHRHH